MSTNINISTSGNSLPERVRAQQKAARATRITREELDRQNKQNRDRLLSDARTTDAARTALTGAPVTPPSASPAQFRGPDPAATRFASPTIGHILYRRTRIGSIDPLWHYNRSFVRLVARFSTERAINDPIGYTVPALKLSTLDGIIQITDTIEVPPLDYVDGTTTLTFSDYIAGDAYRISGTLSNATSYEEDYKEEVFVFPCGGQDMIIVRGIKYTRQKATASNFSYDRLLVRQVSINDEGISELESLESFLTRIEEALLDHENNRVAYSKIPTSADITYVPDVSVTYYSAYVCNNKTGIRKIDVPDKLKTILDKFNEYESTSESNQAANSFTFRNSWDSVIGRSIPVSLSTASPQIFRFINHYLPFFYSEPFVDPTLLRDFPETRRPLTEDDRIGFYFVTTPEDPTVGEDTSLNYTYYTGPPFSDPYFDDVRDLSFAFPDQYILYKNARQVFFKFNIPRSRIPSIVIPPGFEYDPATFERGILYRVWDWNMPAYCKEMCLALGFTEEDLTP